MKIKFDKRYKRTIVQIFDSEEDDDPQVLEFQGDHCIRQAYETNGHELEENYATVEKIIETDAYGQKVLVISARRRS
jgi:hypothetical protein